MKSLKPFFVLVFITCSVFSLFSLSYDGAWKSLDDARLKFEEGDLGQALKYAENAKEIRKNESTAAVESLENALKPLAVQNVGDLLDDVVKILEERMENEALKYIRNLTNLYGKDYFNNSIANIKEFYKKRSVYPEADYLIAKIYMQEGEYATAADFYEKALVNSSVLDVPDERYDILYDAAELSRLRKDENKFEYYLTQVLRDNSDFYNESNKQEYTPYLKAILGYLEREKTTSINKFFMLYRSSHYKSLSALLKLTDYYMTKKEYDLAYPACILSVLTSFTRINEIITARNKKYSYNTNDSNALESFFAEALKHRDIINWMNKNNVWRGFYNFGRLLAYKGYYDLSKQIFEITKNVCPDKTIVNLIKKEIQ